LLILYHGFKKRQAEFCWIIIQIHYKPQGSAIIPIYFTKWKCYDERENAMRFTEIQQKEIQLIREIAVIKKMRRDQS